MSRIDVRSLENLIYSFRLGLGGQLRPTENQGTGNEYGEVFARIEAVGERLVARVQEEVERAGPLCAELLQAPAEKRRELLAEARFHTVSVTRRLLFLAACQRIRDRGQTITIAEYALEICTLMRAEPAEKALLEEARVQAWCEIAAARLDLGEREPAQKALRAAARHLGDDLVTLERGGFVRILGRLRATQDRVDEALALFDRAAALFAELGQEVDRAKVLAEKGALVRRINPWPAAAPTPRPAPAPAAPQSPARSAPGSSRPRRRRW